MRRVHLLLALAAVLAAPLAAQTAPPSGALAAGIEHFQAGRYEQALAAFRGIALSTADDPEKPAASFWLAKTHLAAGRIDEAALGLERYLAAWPTAADRAEAVYLQGRVLHQQEDYEGAIRVFRQFLQEFPSSPLAANAWFWSAECLFGLGRLEEASVLYRKVVREYPTSAKVEAADYKSSLIKLTQREQELSRLLKWSHEEFLRTIEDYQRRLQASDQAIAVLQKRLAGSGAAAAAPPQTAAASPTASASPTEADATLDRLREELAGKYAEAAALAGRVSDLETQLAAAKAAAGAEDDAAAAAAEAAEVYNAALAQLRDEVEAKAAEAARLASRIAELEKELAAANERAAAAEAAAAAAGGEAVTAAETARLLAAKAEALALKERLLDVLAGTGPRP